MCIGPLPIFVSCGLAGMHTPGKDRVENKSRATKAKILKLCDCFSIFNIITVYLRRLYFITMSTLIKAVYATNFLHYSIFLRIYSSILQKLHSERQFYASHFTSQLLSSTTEVTIIFSPYHIIFSSILL